MKYEWSFGSSTFKRRLIFLMEERSLSQQTVADLSGVSQGTVSRWLAGSVPDLKAVTSLAAGLAVPMEWLAHGEGNLKIPYRGIDGFIHRAKTKVLPRLSEVIEKLFGLEDADFLPPEEKEIIENIRIRLAKRGMRISECIEALEKLPPDEGELVTDILAKFKPHKSHALRLEICWLLGLNVRESNDSILKACEAMLKQNPKDKLPRESLERHPRNQLKQQE